MQDDAAILEHLRVNHFIRRHRLACRGLERVPYIRVPIEWLKPDRGGYRAPEPKRWSALWF